MIYMLFTNYSIELSALIPILSFLFSHSHSLIPILSFPFSHSQEPEFKSALESMDNGWIFSSHGSGEFPHFPGDFPCVPPWLRELLNYKLRDSRIGLGEDPQAAFSHLFHPFPSLSLLSLFLSPSLSYPSLSLLSLFLSPSPLSPSLPLSPISR